MKNVLRSIFLASMAAVCLVGTSGAVDRQTNYRWKWDPITVRTNAAANPAPGYVDSTVFMIIGTESNASSGRDTTIAYSTDGWRLPRSGAAAADTSNIGFVVVIGDAGSDQSDAASDSLSLAVQVSHDGINFATALTFKGGTAASTITTGNNQAHVNGVFMDHLSVNGAGVSPHMWVFKFKDIGETGNVAPDRFGVLDFPYIRFVIRYIEATGYKLTGRIGHWETLEK